MIIPALPSAGIGCNAGRKGEKKFKVNICSGGSTNDVIIIKKHENKLICQRIDKTEHHSNLPVNLE